MFALRPYPLKVNRASSRFGCIEWFLGSSGVWAMALLVGSIAWFPPRVAHCQTENAPSAEQTMKWLREADRQLRQQAFEKAYSLAKKAAASATDSASVQQRAAEICYLAGYAEESLPLFERVVMLAPKDAPENWQRGIALATCGRFREGAEQFKSHHDVNPDDVENSAWYFLCIAKTKGIPAARKTVIPSRGDGRQPMMSILAMLKGTMRPDEVIDAATKDAPVGRAGKLAVFYAHLYVGLYHDSVGNELEARDHLRKSLGFGLDGYMAGTARVYLETRFEPEKHETGKSDK